MMEDAFFIGREISCYGAMLKLRMDNESRATLERLLADAIVPSYPPAENRVIDASGPLI
jgi:hypothetical protein